MIGNYAFLQHTKIMFSQILKFWNFNQGNQSIHEENSKENIYRNNIYFNRGKQFWLKQIKKYFANKYYFKEF